MIIIIIRMYLCMLLDRNYLKLVLIRNVVDCNWLGIFFIVLLISLFYYVYINE